MGMITVFKRRYKCGFFERYVYKKSPNWLFVPVANACYSLMPKREKLRIKCNSWLIQKGGLALVSPTPKFLGFGLRTFETKS
jgi:hypothetical protein